MSEEGAKSSKAAHDRHKHPQLLQSSSSLPESPKHSAPASPVSWVFTDNDASSAKETPSSPRWPLPRTATGKDDDTLRSDGMSTGHLSDAWDLYDLLEVPEGKPSLKRPPPAPSATRLNDAWWEDDSLNPHHISTTSSRPITYSSRASTTSSIGTIPEFPVPGAAPSARKNVNSLSSTIRRGPSSHYSQPPDVAPIAEESGMLDSHGSYASSMAVPIAIAEEYSEDEKQPDVPAEGQKHAVGQSEVPAKPAERSSEADIVPPLSVMTAAIKEKNSKESMGSDMSRQKRKSTSPRHPFPSKISDVRRQNQASPVSDPSQSSILFDPSSSESDASQGWAPKGRGPNMRQDAAGNQTYFHNAYGTSIPSPLGPPRSPALGTPPMQNSNYKTRASFGDRFGAKRPPQLNVAAVRQAEDRSSMHSLPDLIWKATRLAANLDRGRTASTFSDDGLVEKPKKTRKTDSITDMLASFPPPALATPTENSRGAHSPSRFGHGYGSSQTKEYVPEKGMQRKCCGIPRWLFLALAMTVILIVAAVVTIVIVLVVIPEQDDSGSSAGGSSASCESQLTCRNGGTNVMINDECRCFCINGYTGVTCQITTDEGCTTIDVARADDASVGEAIPEVIEDSKSVFNIPLNASIVVSQFAAKNFSCTSQNALVTFKNLAPRSVAAMNDAFAAEQAKMNGAQSVMQAPPTNPTATNRVLHARDAQRNAPAVTSNGIIIQGNPDPTAGPEADDVDDDVGDDGDRDGGDLSAEAMDPEEERQLEFARVVVLFALQTTSVLDAALSAQDAFQDYFQGNPTVNDDARNITLGGGFSADLMDFRIAWPGGIIGGTAAPAAA